MGRPGRPRKDKSLRTVDRKPIRPLERQRMRPWLQKMLEEGGSQQISWLNKRDKTFKMAWKHAAGQNWDRGQDCNLFELWARHTGKYYDGDKPDHKRWKANFRCALNSLLDVEELKEKGVKRGNNAYKVYRFLEEKRQKKSQAVKAEPIDEEEYIRRSVGTRSRPRRPTYDLDSEGSELGAMEQEDYSDCDELKKDTEVENPEHSPLPHFDQICAFPDLQSSFCPTASRFPEASSPQTNSSSSSSDDDSRSTVSSAPTDEELISILLEPDEQDIPNFWHTYPYLIDVTVQEGPEEVLDEDGGPVLASFIGGETDFDGPSVVVEQESDTPDFSYTSLESL